MPSKLLNLHRKLTWKDFGTPRKGTPQPGTTFVAANTVATYDKVINGEQVPGDKKKVRLKDDVEIKILLVSAQTWVLAWTLAQPLAFRNKILHHEQGHYDLVALFSRDLFNDLMALRSKTFNIGPALGKATNAILTSYDKPLVDVHPKYDHATKRGQNAAGQKKWDGYIQTAFNKDRSPAVKGHDGKNLKVPLLDVLKKAGITF